MCKVRLVGYCFPEAQIRTSPAVKRVKIAVTGHCAQAVNEMDKFSLELIAYKFIVHCTKVIEILNLPLCIKKEVLVHK